MNLNPFVYHQETAHRRGRLGGGFLRWNAGSDPIESLRRLPRVPFPPDTVLTEERPFFDVFGQPLPQVPKAFGFADLAAVLDISCGVTAQARAGCEIFLMRSVPSAGALYPCELYVVVSGLHGLQNGLYLFDVAMRSLVKIRGGDPGIWAKRRRGGASGRDPLVSMVVSTVYFRTARKYGKRAYRYCLLDTGHMLENLVLSLNAAGVSAQVQDDFEDQKVEAFLEIDPLREGALGVVETMNAGTSFHDAGNSPKKALPSKGNPAPWREDAMATILSVHRATSRRMERGASLQASHDGISEDNGAPILKTDRQHPKLLFSQVARSRRSRRNFVKQEVPKKVWLVFLKSILSPWPGSPWWGVRSLLAVERFEGLEPGIYEVDMDGGELRIRKKGFWLEASARACLDQAWLSHAACHWAFFADVQGVTERWGARAYRRLMLASGRMGQRVYLVSTALGLGACGIGAFYDAEAAEVFDMVGEADLLYLVGVGLVKKWI